MGFFSIVGGIFGAISFVVKFLKEFLVKYATHGVILSIQFTITSATILFVVAFYTFTITTFVALYNQAIELIDYFLNNSNSALSKFYGLLDCVGFLPALDAGVTMFFSALGSIMLFHLTKFTYHAMGAVKNEIFKLVYY